MCEISSIISRSVKCSNEIYIQRGVWQKWKDFNNQFDYYIYHVKFHYVICIQRRDTQATLALDLIVNHINSTWYIRVREVEWKPGNWTVKTSKHKWHAAAALKAVHAFATSFAEWKVVANNCSSWATGVVGFMSDDKKRELYECEPITDDFDKLSTFGCLLYTSDAADE